MQASNNVGFFCGNQRVCAQAAGVLRDAGLEEDQTANRLIRSVEDPVSVVLALNILKEEGLATAPNMEVVGCYPKPIHASHAWLRLIKCGMSADWARYVISQYRNHEDLSELTRGIEYLHDMELLDRLRDVIERDEKPLIIINMYTNESESICLNR